MQITVLREFWLDPAHGVIATGAVVDVEDIRARQLIQRGLAAEGVAPASKAKSPRANKARQGAPANKGQSHPAANANDEADDQPSDQADTAAAEASSAPAEAPPAVDSAAV